MIRPLFRFSNNKTKRWYLSHINDHYVKESKRLNYRSRAAFKLLQLNEKYRIIKANDTVADLGSSPVFKVDGLKWHHNQLNQLKRTLGFSPSICQIRKKSQVQNIQQEMQDRLVFRGKFDTSQNRINVIVYGILTDIEKIISDMAPNFSGELSTDHIDIVKLNIIAMTVALVLLKKGGNIVMKTLNGQSESEGYKFYSYFFKEFFREKPSSSKSTSSEIFYIGKGFGLNAVEKFDLLEIIFKSKQQYQSLTEQFPNKEFINKLLLEIELNKDL